MTAFRTIEDLTTSLEAGGLADKAAAIAATARPAILFVREQRNDGTLPPATSKLGGDPDLPYDVPWPQRAPLTDAVRRAEDIRMTGAHVRTALARADADASMRAYLDRQSAIDELKIAQLFKPSPLAFVAQLNLEQLASMFELPAELPRSGLLSLFRDVLSEQIALQWHEGPADRLRRRAMPDALQDYAKRCGPAALYAEPSMDWDRLSMAEVFHPFAAITVPHHWTSAFPAGSALHTRMWDWFQDHENGFMPGIDDLADIRPEAPGQQIGNFGDRLAGWPDCIQGDVEADLAGERMRVPGQTAWRHLLSYGAEYFGDTRLLPPDGSGDGNTFVMLNEADMLFRRFGQARIVYQQT
jgi:hypothetical protein